MWKRKKAPVEGDRNVLWMLVKRGDDPKARQLFSKILSEMESPELYAMRRDAVLLAERITDEILDRS